MKVLFPRNIEKGFLNGMKIQLGPISISLVQMLVSGVGIAGALAIINSLMKSGYSTVIAIAAGIPVALIFIVIAFFEISEMTLIPFLAKKVRNSFFDTMTKFQCNMPHIDEVSLLLAKHRHKKQVQKIEQKHHSRSDSVVDKLAEQGLL